MRYLIGENRKKETWYIEKYEDDGYIYLTEDVNEAKTFGKKEAEKIAQKNGMFIEKL